MPSSILLRALGLTTSPNALMQQDGSLSDATDVVIRRDNIIEPRRGFRLYGVSFGTSTDRAKQEMSYQNTLIRHYNTTLSWDSDGAGTWEDFNGSYTEQKTGYRIRSVESNGNLYFTTSTGIKKISATSSSQFSSSSGYITQAGGVKAIDIQTRLNIKAGVQTSFFTQDSTVGYRVLWAKNDANENLIQGTPSQYNQIYNPLLPLTIYDFNRLIGTLDDIGQGITANTDLSGSMIDNENYMTVLIDASTGEPLTENSTAGTLRTGLINLSTKLDEDIIYATDSAGKQLQISAAAISAGVCTVTFSSGNPTSFWGVNDNIYLTGFVSTGGNAGSINGAQVITGVNSTTLTFTTTSTATGITVTGTSITSNEYRSLKDSNGTLFNTVAVPNSPPTNGQVVYLQSYLQAIITRLQSEKSVVIGSTPKTNFIAPFAITTTATVLLDIGIPAAVDSSYFLQIYRSQIAAASSTQVLTTDVFSNDELQLVYEAFPTSAEISAGIMTVEDITLPFFAGANLYTNPYSGEGLTQANDIPPAANDVTMYKNTVFYANTRTRHRMNLNLLGVVNMITDYGNSITPNITITNGVDTNTYTFVTGLTQTTTVTCVADVANSLSGKYFTINSVSDYKKYYVWYKTSGGTNTDPAPAGFTAIPVYITTGDSNTSVATKTADTINRYIFDFSATVSSATVTVTNIAQGSCTSAAAATSGFTVNVTVTGRGESASGKQVLLSNATSPAAAVDATARSLVRVINRNTSESTYAYYLSTVQGVPGQMNLEARVLDTNIIYVLGNNNNTGASFSPDISPQANGTITNISIANPTVVTCATHGLSNNSQVVITGSDSTPSINGIWTVSNVTTNTFTIPVNVTVGGTKGSIIAAANAQFSSNEVKPNRIYYAKNLQPDAVPILNFFDVGAVNKSILRIFPLRDSLFVFKEDGLWRVSGETAPYNINLFDLSFIVIAADSLDVSNNVIYAWTTQGIATATEAGTSVISRVVDVDILKLQSNGFNANFATITWGIGYESDNSYTVYCAKSQTDTKATIGYRYSNLTKSWTTINKSATCGIINPADDKMYLGAGDTNYIEQERKSFDRTDYADREISTNLSSGNLIGSGYQMLLSSVSNIGVGDVVTQIQDLTVYEYNQLLHKLDSDPGLSIKTYFSSLESTAGDDLSLKLYSSSFTNLASTLDSEPNLITHNYVTTVNSKTGSITSNSAANPTVVTTSSAHGLVNNRIVAISGVSGSTPSINSSYQVTVLSPTTFSIPVNVTVAGTGGTFSTVNSDFRDIRACFAAICSNLNADTGTALKNYSSLTVSTSQEAVITAITTSPPVITLNAALPWITGPLTIYNAIHSTFTYAPMTLDAPIGQVKLYHPQAVGDPLMLKHLREATLMFDNQNFTTATLNFASDLIPSFVPVTLTGSGPGTFGNTAFGGGLFGGLGVSVPFRTYIPMQCQRCRYLVVQFAHATAREKYSILGITVTGEIALSTRAYR